MTFRGKLRALLTAVAILLLSHGALAERYADSISRAEEAISAGNGLAAEIELRKAIDGGAPRSSIAALAGEADLLQGNLAGAREWLDPASFSVETRERGYRALARLELAEGSAEAATQVYDQALAAGVQSAELWVDIGRLRYRSGQHHQARDAAIKAVGLDPGSVRALEFRGQLARDSEGPVPALAWFERAAELVPDDIQLLGEYAATLSEAGNNAKMLGVVRHMVELDPADPKAYFLQSVLAARTGNDRLARKLLDRTNGAYADTPAGQLLDAILDLTGGNPGASAVQLDQLGEGQPDNDFAIRLLGRAQLDDGRPEEVIAKLKPIADGSDASPYVLTLMGRAYEQLDRRFEAADYLDRAGEQQGTAMSISPASGEVPDQLHAQSLVSQLRQLLASDRPESALATVNQMGVRYEGSVDVESLAADVALLSGKPQIALAILSRAAEVRNDFSLVERKVAAQRMLGRDEDARRTLTTFVAAHPRSVSAIALLGRLESQAGRRQRGIELLELANEMSGWRDPILLADLAQAHGSDGAASVQTANQAYELQRSGLRTTSTYAASSRAAGVSALMAKWRTMEAPLMAVN